MKLNLIRTSLGIILLATLVGMAPAAQAHNRSCSQAGVAGTYGYTYTGTIFLPTGAAIPAAAVGRATLDAEGNFSAQQTRSVGGGGGEETLKGTYSVNADCTFTLKADVYDGSGNLARSAVLAGVFDDNATEIRAIFASLVLPDSTSLRTVITVSGKKLFVED
jgi:hypothetical protein